MRGKTIEIRDNEELKIKIEKLEEFDNSIFANVYKRATESTVGIVNNENKEHKDQNNIIAFVGARGTGKSSAMISFANALKNKKEGDIDKYEPFKDLKNWNFSEIDTIDPSMLENNESIFEIIIAKMFAKFKTHVENQNIDTDLDDKRDLLRSFQNEY